MNAAIENLRNALARNREAVRLARQNEEWAAGELVKHRNARVGHEKRIAELEVAIDRLGGTLEEVAA